MLRAVRVHHCHEFRHDDPALLKASLSPGAGLEIHGRFRTAALTVSTFATLPFVEAVRVPGMSTGLFELIVYSLRIQRSAGIAS